MAYFTFFLVQRLSIHSVGWKQRRKLDADSKYIYYISRQWILAWSKLDFYCLGRIKCFVYHAFYHYENQSKEFRCRCKRANVPINQRRIPSGDYFLFSCVLLDFLSSGKCSGS